MAIHDVTSQRLFVDAVLAAGTEVACTSDQANYLRNVMRMGTGTSVLIFNGRDGEWRATLDASGKRTANLRVAEQTRAQTDGPDIDYLFAPLKRARLDYMVQKATEMGVARLRPVLTRHTIAERVNIERMRANTIEAAEQCGVLRVPEVRDPQKLEHVLAQWDAGRTLIFCDEATNEKNPITQLKEQALGPIAVLIGPEGGFSAEERASLRSRSFVVPLSLGPRIMRADTAAVAALAIVNAVLGDWR
jgi:16S rRNA (uracil1498-N3)-methyltransferase